MGFNTGTLTRAELDGFLEDHKVEFSRYLAESIVGDTMPVGNKKTSVRKWSVPLGYGSDGDRSASVNFGEPHPRGRSGMDTVDVDCAPIKWGEDIEKHDLTEMEKYVQAANDLSLAAGHQVMRARDQLLANIVGGSGTAATDTDVSSFSIPSGEGWATDTSPIITHIRDAQDAIGGSDLICVMGRDRARQISLNDYFTGAAAGSGTPYVLFSRIAELLMDEGITQTYVGGAKYVNGERDFDSGFANLFDGVFYLGTPENLKMMEFAPLRYEEDEDKDKGVKSFFAEWVGCFRRAYVQNGISFTNFAGS
jgi:hypothetical protein